MVILCCVHFHLGEFWLHPQHYVYTFTHYNLLDKKIGFLEGTEPEFRDLEALDVVCSCIHEYSRIQQEWL